MTDALAQLPHLSFRGIVVPVMGVRSATFAHANVKHKFQYRDGELVETTGAHNWTFSYTIPFRQDISAGPYRNLYTDTLPQFILAVRDRTPGDLIDPELGLFRATPTQATSELDVTKRDGSDWRIEFEHAPELTDLELEDFATLEGSGLATEAGLLDQQLTLVDWEQEEPPEPSADILSTIDGIGRQLEFQANKISNKLDDTAYRLEKIESTIDRLENPQTWGLRRSSRRLRDSVLRLKAKGQDPARRIITVAQRYAATLSVVASDAGMTVQELLQLNPGLAMLPEVAAGTRINRFAA